MGDLRRALVQGDRAAGGTVHDRRHCGVARPDTRWLADRHHLWRRPARRGDRLPRFPRPADVDGRAVGHVPDCGPGRGRRLVLWPCCLWARHARSHPELAHSRQAGLRRPLPGGACRRRMPRPMPACSPSWSSSTGSIRSSNIYDIKWNSFSRIAAAMPIMGPPYLWGPSPVMPRGSAIEQRELTIDGMAGTWMPKYSDAPGRMDFLRYDVTNLAYYARHEGRSAVIGVGSGRDMLSAYLFGFRDITGVELNPIFVDLLTNPAKLRAYAGVADLPGTRFVVDDGRSWFARTQEKFDLIEMSMVDTWAATGAGAFSLSENGLYTVEGWKTFLSALKPNGLFTVSRWHSPRSTVELGRVVSLAVAALDGTRRRSSQRPHLHRRDRQSRHRHRVARAIRPIRPADTAGNRRQIALHRARQPGPARHGSGHRRHAHGAKPAGPECAGSAPLPRRVAADRRQAVLLQSASVYPPERHLLRPARMARRQASRFGIRLERQPHRRRHAFPGHLPVGHRGRIRRRPADAVRRSPGRPAIGADRQRLFSADRTRLHVRRDRADPAHLGVSRPSRLCAQHRTFQHHSLDRAGQPVCPSG